MTFVENEFQVIALYNQNELHEVQPGDEAEIALKTYPGGSSRRAVDSIVWAQGQGQIPMSPTLPQTGTAPLPPGRFAVRLDDCGTRTRTSSWRPAPWATAPSIRSPVTTSTSCAR